MDIAAVVFLIGVLVFAAHLFNWLFSLSKIPNVLLLMLFGLLVGPVLQWFSPEFFGQAGDVFSLIVLAVILFEGGMQMRLDALTNAWQSTTLFTLLVFTGNVLTAALLVWYALDIPLLAALAFGAILGGTSSSVVIPLLQGINGSEETETALTLESAFTDVLSVVVGTAFLTAWAAGEFAASRFAWNIAASFIGAAAIGAGGGMFWSLLLNKVRMMENSMFTTPAFMFILFGITEYIGWSGPIAALAFGVTLGNVVFFKLWLERKHMILNVLLHPLAPNDQERSFFSEVVFVLQTFFFVFVGVSIPVTDISVLYLAIALIVATLAVRIPLVRFTSPKTRSSFDRMYLAAIAPKGLAAAVLASLLIANRVPYADLLRDTIYVVIFLSVIVTSLLVVTISRDPQAKLYEEIVGGKTRSARLSKAASIS